MNKMRKMLNGMRNRKGFTMIELVCVIAILIILMAIAVPKFVGMQDQARIAADRASIETINKCIALHTAVNNFTSLVGQTSMTITSPIKNGDSVTTILTFLKDKGLLQDTATIYFATGHSYVALENRVN